MNPQMNAALPTTYPLAGLISMFADDHRADDVRGGCSCGFCVWSPEHVAIMAYIDAVNYERTRLP